LELKYQQYLVDKEVFSILLIDLDRFKFINDCYGYDVGDNILCITAQMLQRSLRDQDVISRWGGNEYMVLLHGATGDNATKVGDRLRLNARKLDIQAPQGDKLTISLSLGGASSDKCTGVDNLISTAENGIYQAKHMGRDRVVIG
jgi:diguanylate cyclase (GGDEF)-like protein